MKILILGGAGFVGSNLAKYFAKQGKEVTVMDNLVRRGSENNLSLFTSMKIEFIHGDIRNPEDLNRVKYRNYDVVLLCAAQPSATNYDNPVFDITNNTLGVLNVLEFIRMGHAKSLIFWSTNKCYSGRICNSIPLVEESTRFSWDTSYDSFAGWSSNGFNEALDVNGGDHSIYGISKITADLLIQEWADAYKIPAIINRFSCLAGPNQWGKSEQGWVTWFAIANELQLPLTFYGYKGKQVRDCLFTDDINNLISKQIVELQKGNIFGEVFNVGGGKSNTVSLIEAVNLIEQKTKKIFEPITIKDEERRADQRIYISDTSKVRARFNWQPNTTISEGYDQIIEWVKANKSKLKELYNG